MSRTIIKSLSLFEKGETYFFQSSIYDINDIDVVNKLISFYLYKYLNPVLSANILLIIYLFLALLFSYILFKLLIKDKILSLFFSFLFSTSIYFVYRVISYTTNLYQVFFFPLLFILLIKNKTSPILISVLVLFYLSFSSYYGFMCFFIVLAWYFADFIVVKKPFKVRLKKLLYRSTLFVFPIILFLFVFFGRTLVSNVPLFGNYQRLSSEERTLTHSKQVYRPIEDMYNFSFRPWYFLIPPKSSLFFGNLSTSIYQKIENTGYYLANDYTEQESAGSYLGWHFILGLLISLYLIVCPKEKYKLIFKTFYANINLIKKLLIVMLFVLLITHPPSLSISGITFYTPSYLLYKLVPVFRTLVRWAVVIYLITLIINAFLAYDIYLMLKRGYAKVAYLSSFILLSLVIFSIRIPIITLTNPPDEIKYIERTYGDTKFSFTSFPNVDYYSTFWVLRHKNYLLSSNDFSMENYPLNILTESGMKEFKSAHPSFLVFYPNQISEKQMELIYTLNSSISDINSINSYFESNFGPAVYRSSQVLIYSRNNN